MRAQQFQPSRTLTLTSYLALASGALCVALTLAGSASAALIVDSVSYDGHVRNGIITGIEEHSTTTNFPPPNASIQLPASNGPLTPPLNASNNLTMTYTTATEQFPVPGGPLYATSIIQISSPSGNVFANPLDNSLTYPVQFEAFIYSDVPTEKIVLQGGNIGIENFNLPPFDAPLPGSYSITGSGTQADPLRIQLRLTAGQVDDDNGFVKLHLRYTTMVIPEPNSWAIAALGCVGWIGMIKRRRSTSAV